MEDCRKDKELKQSTCRYVKKCDPGWTRNEKFICRKTTRRLRNNDNNVVHFNSQNSIVSPNLENNEFKHVYENKQQKEAKRVRKTTFKKNRNQPKPRSRKSRKTKVGNYINYTHPDGRKERAKVMKIRPEDGAHELYIPSLDNEWSGPTFKKNEIAYYIYKNGMREKATILKVVNQGEYYEIHLQTTNKYKTVMPDKLRKLGDYPTVPKGSALSEQALGTAF